MNADDYCARRIAATRSSLFYATLFASDGQRRDLNVLFTLGAELHQVASGVSDVGVAAMKLQWWREEILRALEGGGGHPLAPALARCVRTHDLPAEYFMAMVDAVQMDLEPAGYPDMAALNAYLYRAGAVPSLLAAEVLGRDSTATERYAEQLGFALRLIEIVRSVRDDATYGRIYLPRERMAAHRVEPGDLVAARTPDRLAGLLAELAEHARRCHGRALELLPEAARTRQRPGLIAGRLYLDLLARIERAGYRVTARRFALSPARKLWLAWRTARRGGD